MKVDSKIPFKFGPFLARRSAQPTASLESACSHQSAVATGSLSARSCVKKS
jgi:hypothetical protein